jgi:hypothetical protein
MIFIINRRGFGITLETVMYILLFLVFFLGMFWYVTGQQDGAALWEDFYAMEIAFLINNLEPGTEVKLDVSEISRIAVENEKEIKREMIQVDNVENTVRVSLGKGKGSTFRFFNDVDILEPGVELFSGGPNTNQFIFKVGEKKRDD